MALYSIERCVAISYPLKIKQIFTTSRKIAYICMLVLFSSISYTYIILINNLDVREASSFCSVYSLEMLTIYKIFSNIDRFLSVFLPFVIIIVVNIYIVHKMRNSRLKCENANKCRGKYMMAFLINENNKLN